MSVHGKKPSSLLLYGRNILREAVAAQAPITEVFVETEAAHEFVLSIHSLNKKNLKIEGAIPKSLLKEPHQGVAFRTTHEFYRDASSLNFQTLSRVVLCNHVEDVHNLGSITRSAAAFATQLIVHEDTKSASITASVVKASAGCAFKLSFSKVSSLGSIIKKLQDHGFQICAFDTSREAKNLYQFSPSKKVALLLGSEGDGVDASLLSMADQRLHIPMARRVNSLNVSHAAAIALSYIHSFDVMNNP